MPDSNKKKPEVVIDLAEAMKYPPIAVPASKRSRRKSKERAMKKNLDLTKIRRVLRVHHGGPGPHKDGSSQDVHGGGRGGSKAIVSTGKKGEDGFPSDLAGNLVEIRPLRGGEQALFAFDNGYGASVIRHDISYGGRQGLMELAVIRWTPDPDIGSPYTLVYDTSANEGTDVLGELTPTDVARKLRKIKGLPDIAIPGVVVNRKNKKR